MFLPVTRCDVNMIMRTLYSIGISEENARDAYENLATGRINNGITFSNPDVRETVAVVALADEPGSYLNLLVHESHHLSVHIATAVGYDLEGEEVCYMHGNIAEFLFPMFYPLLCGNTCSIR